MTAEWLANRGVPIECFKISALTRGHDQFLQCNRVFSSTATSRHERSDNSKGSVSLKVPGGRDEDRKSRFWQYAAPLLCDAGILQTNHPKNYSPRGFIEATLGRNHLRLRVGGKGALIEVSASAERIDTDQRVLRRLSNVRGMLDRGLCGATLRFSGGSNRPTTISASKVFDLSQEQSWPEITLWIVENSTKLLSIFKRGMSG